MYDGLQQVLVAEHDSRAAAVVQTLSFAQPSADIACLDVLRGRRDETDVLGYDEVAIDVGRSDVEFVGIVFQIAPDVLSGLVTLQVVVVEIPVEMRLARLLQFVEQLHFDLL